MSFFLNEKATPIDQKQGRLLQLAALFLLLYSVCLTLSPAARLQSWDVPYRWNHWIGFVTWLVGVAIVHHQITQRYPERDPYLFPIAALLAGWGVLEIWRLDPVMGARQTAWLAFCLLVVWLGLRAPLLLNWLRRYKYLWLTSGLIITALTFFFGTYPGGVGPHLWLGCCGVYFQPSEPLKLLLIVYLAAYLADRLPISFSLVVLLVPTLLLAGAALALLVAQRDLGTASLFILIYAAVIYMASGRKRILVISGLLLVIAALAGYFLFDVVRVRIDSWVNPWLDPSGRSFQIVQSLLAVANGELIGRGPGLGDPAVVPVSHSDFIFASITEETGLLGSVGMLAIYALLVGRGIRAALYAPNNFRRYLAAGLMVYLTLQTILIAGGNLRLLPLTGVTLPFVSYGGSSLLTAFISILLLIIVSDRNDEEPAPLPSPAPYLFVSAGLLAGLAALAILDGWWSGIRSADLLARPDNPRWSINERYVARGTLLDRNNAIIDQSTGEPGALTRVYQYPPLSDTTGYVSIYHGMAGLESSLDLYLRGLRGNPSLLILWNRLLNGQPPPGLNMRLTIDLNLQREADKLMEGHSGALVLLNSQTGEVLVMASHPYFDPSQIDNTWPELMKDQRAPLLNRATQGQYPPGTALGPFLLAAASNAQETLPNLPQGMNYSKNGKAYQCALPYNAASPAWGDAIASGCPAPLVILANSLPPGELEKLFQSLGFYLAPDIPLNTANPAPNSIQDSDLAAIGQDKLVITPLQMAIAAAVFNNAGVLPPVHIANSVESTTQGWLELTPGNSSATLLAGKTDLVVKSLKHGNSPYWQVTGSAYSSQTHLTWFIGGTLVDQPAIPLTLALVLEEDNVPLANKIGESLLQDILTR